MKRKLAEWPKTVVFVPFGIFILCVGLYGLLDTDVTCGGEPMIATDRCLDHTEGDGESILRQDRFDALPQRPRGIELPPQLEDTYATMAGLHEWAGRSRDGQRARDNHANRVIVILGVVTTGAGVASVYIAAWWRRRKFDATTGR